MDQHSDYQNQMDVSKEIKNENTIGSNNIASWKIPKGNKIVQLVMMFALLCPL